MSGSACPTAALVFTLVLEDQIIANGWRVLSKQVDTSLVLQPEFLGSLNTFAFSALMG